MKHEYYYEYEQDSYYCYPNSFVLKCEKNIRIRKIKGFRV